jgi:hypothetical protein
MLDYLKSNVGIFVHPKYLGLIAEWQALYVVSVGLDGLGFRGIVDPRGRILVVLLQSVGRKEPLEDRPQAALVPGISDPATICDLQCVYEYTIHYGLC